MDGTRKSSPMYLQTTYHDSNKKLRLNLSTHLQRKTKEALGEGCGVLDGGKCLESRKIII